MSRCAIVSLFALVRGAPVAIEAVTPPANSSLLSFINHSLVESDQADVRHPLCAACDIGCSNKNPIVAACQGACYVGKKACDATHGACRATCYAGKKGCDAARGGCRGGCKALPTWPKNLRKACEGKCDQVYRGCLAPMDACAGGCDKAYGVCLSPIEKCSDGCVNTCKGECNRVGPPLCRKVVKTATEQGTCGGEGCIALCVGWCTEAATAAIVAGGGPEDPGADAVSIAIEIGCNVACVEAVKKAYEPGTDQFASFICSKAGF